MNPDTERRLRAALRAGADLIDEPSDDAPGQPPTAPSRLDRQRPRSRGRWLVPASVAAAVALIAACTIVVVRITASQQNAPVGPAVPLPVAPTVTSPTPEIGHSTAPNAAPARTAPSPAVSETSPAELSTSATNVDQQPLTGPQVLDARLLGSGHGYVRTRSALLWTGDDGAHWRDITPPGLSPAQLQNAGVAVHSDGRAWIAAAPKAGDRTVTIQRRSAATGHWSRTAVPLGALTIPPDGGPQMSLSFADATHGWLMVFLGPGRGELLRTTDGGASWSRQREGGAAPVGLIHFLSPTIGFLDTSLARQNLGWWITRDAGASWSKLTLPLPGKGREMGFDAVVTGAPILVDGTILVAVEFVLDLQGYDGSGIYRSTDGGKSWSLRTHGHPYHGPRPAGWRSFAASPDGSSSVLLYSRTAADGHGYSWVTSRSTDHGQNFTDTTSVVPAFVALGPVTTTRSGELWALGGTNACGGDKLDCWNTSALFASPDGGASWHQVRLPH